jgi:hypothetical protein
VLFRSYLPERTYILLTPKGTTQFRNTHIGRSASEIYGILGNQLQPATKNGEIKKLAAIPVSTRGEKFTYVSDVLLRNLESRAPWYRGLGGVATIERDNRVGLSEKEWESLKLLINKLGEPMENAIRQRMNSLYGSLILHYLNERYPGNNSPEAWGKARDRAYKFAISIRLNRATNRPAIRKAILQIQEESGNYVALTPEEWEWIDMLAQRNPVDAQTLLLMGCAMRDDKETREGKKEAKAKKEAEAKAKKEAEGAASPSAPTTTPTIFNTNDTRNGV